MSQHYDFYFIRGKLLSRGKQKGRAFLRETLFGTHDGTAPPCEGSVATMSNTSCTLRTRKFMTNRLLARRQFVSARIPEGILRTGCGDAGVFRDAALSGDAAFATTR